MFFQRRFAYWCSCTRLANWSRRNRRIYTIKIRIRFRGDGFFANFRYLIHFYFNIFFIFEYTWFIKIIIFYGGQHLFFYDNVIIITIIFICAFAFFCLIKILFYLFRFLLYNLFKILLTFIFRKFSFKVFNKMIFFLFLIFLNFDLLFLSQIFLVIYQWLQRRSTFR